MKNITQETLLDHLVDFAQNLRFEDLPEDVVREAKLRFADSVACAMGGWKDSAVRRTRALMNAYGTTRYAGGSMLGAQERYTPWDAAYANTHMIRALDWNDTYLSLEPAHPSDNLGGLFAACGLKRESVTGKEFLTAMALAYDIQCRFCDAASLRARGWDHVCYVTIASALACAKVLGLSGDEMKEALSLALNSNITMRQVRAGSLLSMEKGASSAEATRAALWGAMRARIGFTGPKEIFEGQFGFVNQVSGPLRLEAFEDIGRTFKLPQTYIKLYPVEYHAQAVVEAALLVRKQIQEQVLWSLTPETVDHIRIESYEAARTIIGDSAKRRPQTKESADHSIFYILALTLLDGRMTLAQYHPSRFEDPNVRGLIDKICDVEEVEEFNRAYGSQEFPVRVSVRMNTGEEFSATVRNPMGHPARPMSSSQFQEKFETLCQDLLKTKDRGSFFESLMTLEQVRDIKHMRWLWEWGYV